MIAILMTFFSLVTVRVASTVSTISVTFGLCRVHASTKKLVNCS